MSERQLDEEFGQMKLFSLEGLDNLRESIANFGLVPSVINRYAKERLPASELATPVNGPPAVLNSANNTKNNKANSNNSANINNNNHNNNIYNNNNFLNGNASRLSNGSYVNEFEQDEGEFIEVKKPRKICSFIFGFS